MAIANATSVAQIVSSVLYQTVKNELKQRFVELVAKDIEPLLEEYAKQIVMNVTEMRDPHSFDGLKLNVSFKIPSPPQI